MSVEILRRAADAMRNDALSMEANSMPADAAWHPDVALAVADWIDHQVVAAKFHEQQDAENEFADGYMPRAGTVLALAVAHAYLGES